MNLTPGRILLDPEEEHVQHASFESDTVASMLADGGSDTVSSTTVGRVMDRRIVARSGLQRAGSAQSAAAWSRSGTSE